MRPGYAGLLLLSNSGRIDEINEQVVFNVTDFSAEEVLNNPGFILDFEDTCPDCSFKVLEHEYLQPWKRWRDKPADRSNLPDDSRRIAMSFANPFRRSLTGHDKETTVTPYMRESVQFTVLSSYSRTEYKLDELTNNEGDVPLDTTKLNRE